MMTTHHLNKNNKENKKKRVIYDKLIIFPSSIILTHVTGHYGNQVQVW